jgi:C-3',4' desaturase CrtD
MLENFLKQDNYDYVILGAGIGGLVTANLLAQRKYRVLVLEAHYHCGGCASFFDHRGFNFDVGATTLSGFAYGGPLKRIQDELGITFHGESPDLPMQIHLNGKIINRFKSNDDWISELNKKIPGQDHEKVWSHLSSLNKKSWELMNELRNFPPQNAQDFLNLLRPGILKSSLLLPNLFLSLEKKFPNYLQQNPELRQLLDEQLMISVQNQVGKVGSLTSAMGLCYPEDILIPRGGFKSFNRVLTENYQSLGGELKMRHQVISFRKENGKFLISTDKGEFRGSKVISNIPYWSLAEKIESPFRDKFKKTIAKFDDCWGAMTAYLKIKLTNPVEIPYHQVHLDGGGAFFFSFSIPEDLSKSPPGSQAVTISTHINPDLFLNLERKSKDYLKLKEEFKIRVRQEFRKVFEGYGIKSLEVTAVGTPLTFERYTGRDRGFVGGVVHHLSRPPIAFPSQQSNVKDFYVVGDSTFPGQGVVGVTQGALLLCDRLSSRGRK